MSTSLLHEQINHWAPFKVINGKLSMLYVIFEELGLTEAEQEKVFLGFKSLGDHEIRMAFQNKGNLTGRVKQFMLIHYSRKKEEPGWWSAFCQRWFG
jgi:hypothetical protein